MVAIREKDRLSQISNSKKLPLAFNLRKKRIYFQKIPNLGFAFKKEKPDTILGFKLMSCFLILMCEMSKSNLEFVKK